jgi:hypothetical protein
MKTFAITHQEVQGPIICRKTYAFNAFGTHKAQEYYQDGAAMVNCAHYNEMLTDWQFKAICQKVLCCCMILPIHILLNPSRNSILI